MDTATLTRPEPVGDAAWWMAYSQPQWFTSDEFAPSVAIGDPRDECPDCGTIAPCPADHGFPCAVAGFHAGPCDEDCAE